MNASKDFNILGFKVSTGATKKDISLVTGYNSYIQKIEHICKTQKGELPSDSSLGSNYYAFIFDPVGNKDVLQLNLAAFLKAAIKDLSTVKATVIYSDTKKFIVNIKFTLKNFTQNQTTECLVEVPLK
jgi:hypothetical protein